MINEETHNQDAGTAAPGDVEAQVAEVPAPSNPAPEASAQQAETPAPAESGSAKPKPDAKRAQEQVEDIKNTTLALVNNAGGAGGLLVLFSLILVIQASVDMKKNRFFAFESYGALAISLGVINLFFGIAILVINKREMLDDKIKQIVIAVMWIFTTICVGVITFKLPYPFFWQWIFFFVGNVLCVNLYVKGCLYRTSRQSARNLQCTRFLCWAFIAYIYLGILCSNPILRNTILWRQHWVCGFSWCCFRLFLYHLCNCKQIVSIAEQCSPNDLWIPYRLVAIRSSRDYN
mmetsp:Transcript_7472/g.9476  ORF Transcript_7472/g.9476 Transcript_7472/m.9476 type:complete len:290 (-) Transcript_7472:1476-2345(-)